LGEVIQRKVSLVIGRFQPFHDGHKALIQTLLNEGKKVCVGIMDTVIDDENPCNLYERVNMIQTAFGDSIEYISIPPIAEVCYGRNVGYKVRRVHHGADTETISASHIRDDTSQQATVMYDPVFIDSFNRVAEQIHETHVNQGFWKQGSKRDPAGMLTHIHSELTEVFEGLRAGNPPDKNISDMSTVEVQLSDVIGMIMDMAQGYGLNVAEALLKKQEFNKSRKTLHGGKLYGSL
jgi:cytidyltransferase-like protein